MITLPHIHAAEVVMYQTFSCFANNAIEANPIVVLVKYIIGESELIAVKKTHQISHPLLQPNAEGQQRKELDVKIKQPIQMGVAIYTKLKKTLKGHEKDNIICDRFQN